MLIIQLQSRIQRNEELGLVIIPLPIVDHPYQSSSIRFDALIELVDKGSSVEGLSTDAVALGGTTLGDKVGDDTVE